MFETINTIVNVTKNLEIYVCRRASSFGIVLYNNKLFSLNVRTHGSSRKTPVEAKTCMMEVKTREQWTARRQPLDEIPVKPKTRLGDGRTTKKMTLYSLHTR